MRPWELKDVLGSSITSAGPLVHNTAETLLFLYWLICLNNWYERPNNLGPFAWVEPSSIGSRTNR